MPKNKTTLYIGLYFVFLFIFNLGYMIGWSIYGPLGHIGWYLASLAPIGLLFLIRFAYHYPKLIFKKESLIVTILFTILALIAIGDYVIHAIQSPVLLTETGWGSTYSSQLIPITLILFYVWTIIVLLRQSIHLSKAKAGTNGFSKDLRYLIKPQGQSAKSAGKYSLIILLELINTISISLFLIFDAISYVTINYTMNTAFLFIACLYVIIYINNSPQTLTFIIKINSISLVTILMVLSFSGYISLFHFNDRYDQERFNDSGILINAIVSNNYSLVPKKLSYIVRQRKDNYKLIYSKKNSFKLPKDLRFWARTPSISQIHNKNNKGTSIKNIKKSFLNKKLFSQIDDNNYYNYPFLYKGKIYLAGYNYIDYRKGIHSLIKNLIVVILLSAFAIMFIFPLLIYNGLIKPLNILVNGIRKADKGDLDVTVPIQFRDEIGRLTHSFNGMINSIKGNHDKLEEYANQLETMVEDRTIELTEANEELEAINESLIETNKALEYAKRIADMDMKMASQVQASLLPDKSPDSKDWDIAFEFKPMSGVSGDFYDFYYEKDEISGVAIFDVSGHGVASGLITMIARSIVLRYFTRMGNVGLDFVLETINKNLIDEISDTDNYLTGILLRFNENKIEYINAAHPAVIMKKSRDGRTGEIKAKNRDTSAGLLGIDDMNNSYNSLVFPIEQDDLILLYTDCLNESKNEAGEYFGKDRIKSSLKKTNSSKAGDILETVLNDFYDFIGNQPLKDDLTIIVIKKK